MHTTRYDDDKLSNIHHASDWESTQRIKVTADCVSVVVALISHKYMALPITLIIIQFHFARLHIFIFQRFCFYASKYFSFWHYVSYDTNTSIDRCINFTRDLQWTAFFHSDYRKMYTN
jgi:hypothetical protein